MWYFLGKKNPVSSNWIDFNPAPSNLNLFKVRQTNYTNKNVGKLYIRIKNGGLFYEKENGIYPNSDAQILIFPNLSSNKSNYSTIQVKKDIRFSSPEYSVEISVFDQPYESLSESEIKSQLLDFQLDFQEEFKSLDKKIDQRFDQLITKQKDITPWAALLGITN